MATLLTRILTEHLAPNLFWASFDTAGKVRWLNTAYQHKGLVGLSTSKINPQIYFSKSESSIYILGYFKDSISLDKSHKLSLNNGHGIFRAKIGLNGNVQKVKTLMTSYFSIQLHKLKFSKDGEIALGIVARNTVTQYDSSSSYSNNADGPSKEPMFCIVRYSPNFDKRKSFTQVGMGWDVKHDFDFTASNGLNVVFTTWDYPNNKIYVVNTYYNYLDKVPRSFLIKYDKDLKLISVSKIAPTSDKLACTNILNTDSGRFFMSGFFQDSFQVGQKAFYTKGTGTRVAYFMGLFDSHDSAVWIKTSNSLSVSLKSISLNFHIPSRMVSFDGDFIFNVFPVPFYSNFILGGDTLLNSLNYSRILKIDRLGNPLWALGSSSGANIVDVISDKDNNLIYNGHFNSIINLSPFSFKSQAGRDGFITKVADYSIFRGDVTSGPYCAGDTIQIPYTKYGKYDTANYFIAELSDEHGEFSGGQRELGRIKSNLEDTIYGRLPLFQVASSEKYRIRIRSTHPQVQSYYRLDTLRLLIYSRDKADPGSDTIICKGDTVKLETFGGTKWLWSPKYKMEDSSARMTLAWPDTTTRYTIIIEDSSGCGEPDTSSKTVFVRKAPRIKTKDNFKTICKSSISENIAHFEFGDSSSYQWYWYEVDNTNNWYLWDSGKFQSLDTLVYKMPINVNDSQRLAVILTDNCSPELDTAYFTIYISQEKAFSSIANADTIVCAGF